MTVKLLIAKGKRRTSCVTRLSSAGKGLWSGYGARPRGKGIVDLCCLSSGCELHHLEMYCAKPKIQQTTYSPSTTLHATTQPNLVRSLLFKYVHIPCIHPLSSPCPVQMNRVKVGAYFMTIHPKGRTQREKQSFVLHKYSQFRMTT